MVHLVHLTAGLTAVWTIWAVHLTAALTTALTTWAMHLTIVLTTHLATSRAPGWTTSNVTASSLTLNLTTLILTGRCHPFGLALAMGGLPV